MLYKIYGVGYATSPETKINFREKDHETKNYFADGQ